MLLSWPVEVHGLGRFPVTLYKEQWAKLLGMADEIQAFIARTRGRTEGQAGTVKPHLCRLAGAAVDLLDSRVSGR